MRGCMRPIICKWMQLRTHSCTYDHAITQGHQKQIGFSDCVGRYDCIWKKHVLIPLERVMIGSSPPGKMYYMVPVGTHLSIGGLRIFIVGPLFTLLSNLGYCSTLGAIRICSTTHCIGLFIFRFHVPSRNWLLSLLKITTPSVIPTRLANIQIFYMLNPVRMLVVYNSIIGRPAIRQAALRLYRSGATMHGIQSYTGHIITFNWICSVATGSWDERTTAPRLEMGSTMGGSWVRLANRIGGRESSKREQVAAGEIEIRWTKLRIETSPTWTLISISFPTRNDKYYIHIDCRYMLHVLIILNLLT